MNVKKTNLSINNDLHDGKNTNHAGNIIDPVGHNFHSIYSVPLYTDEKKPESFDSGFLNEWRSGRDSNPRPPA